MSKWLKAALWGLCFSGMAWFWWYGGHYPIREYLDPSKPLEPGTFGDSFGFINSFFSSMGFMIAMFALVMQIRQTNKSIELAHDAKEDDRRRQEMDMLMKHQNDMAGLLDVIGDAFTSNQAIDLSHSSAIRIARNRIATNALLLHLVFSKDGEPLVRLTNEIAEAVKKWFGTNYTTPTPLEFHRILQQYLDQFQISIQMLWKVRKQKGPS